MTDEEQQQINEARQRLDADNKRRTEGFWADVQMLAQKWGVSLRAFPVVIPQGDHFGLDAEIRIVAN